MFCVATTWVDDSTDQVMTYNGSTWSLPQTLATTYGIEDVSCASASFCVALDGHGHVSTFDGVSWSAFYWPLPPTAPEVALLAVSCASAAWCVAVGYPGAYAYDGSSWEALPAAPGESGDVYDMTDVSCPEVGVCFVAAGESLLEYSAGSWTTMTFLPVSAVRISCSSTSLCVAIDSNRQTYVFDGTTWTESVNLAQEDGESGSGVPSLSCPAGGSFCVSDDSNTLDIFNGATWSSAGYDSKTIDFGVHALACTVSGGCVASLIDGIAMGSYIFP
jgi:hypothetical protein